MKQFLIAISLIFLFSSNLFGQSINFEGIKIQARYSTLEPSVDLDFYLINFSNDTVWHEKHTGLSVNGDDIVQLVLGEGTIISSIPASFSDIDWMEIDHVEIHNPQNTASLIAEYTLYSWPYTFHSLHTSMPIFLLDLTDTPSLIANSGELLVYQGSFIFSSDQLSDSVIWADTSNSSLYSDTTQVAYINANVVDTVIFSFNSDSALFSGSINTVFYSDSSQFSDSTNFAYFTLNNWSLVGNANLGLGNFVGESSNNSFHLSTNSQSRFIFDTLGIRNSSLLNGFSFSTPKNGFIVTPNSNFQNPTLNGAFFYFDGERKSTLIGTTVNSLDSTIGNYSFCFGENVGTNGPYSVILGINSYGDSTMNGATAYSDRSSISIGKNNRVSRIGIAIGENAVADYYRSLAIGKDVTSTLAPAGTAIGNNVYVSGSTGWAMGRNLTVNSPYSAATGQNAHSGGYLGCFIYGDGSTSDTVYNTSSHQFMIRAAGGTVIYSSTDLTMGVQLAPGGGSWNMVSDRNKKYAIEALKIEECFQKIQELTLYQWKYKNQSQTHIGPMAQDFYGLFQVGESNKYINSLDADGTILFGIKDLNKRVLGLKTNISVITEEINSQEISLDEMELKIKELNEKLDNK